MSTASFDAPYGLVGRAGAVSGIGTSSGCPYTAAVEENTSRGTAFARIASSSASEPATLLCQYVSGRSTDSATSALAAKCSTPSYAGPPASTPAASSASVPSTSVAPSGTPSACPVDRSSSTVISWPARSRCSATTLPM